MTAPRFTAAVQKRCPIGVGLGRVNQTVLAIATARRTVALAIVC
jgi:stage V sporulation protein SpoVS